MKKIITILLLSVSIFSAAQTDSAQLVKRIGNKGASKPLSIEYNGNPEHHGRMEVGTLISVRKGPVRIIGARFLINKISMPDTAVFIVNIYEVEDGRPTANGLYRPAKVRGKIKEGNLEVDLTGYNINKDKDFLLALSWPSDRGKISFGAGFGGNRSFHRSDDQEWERAPMKLGFSATVVSTKN